MYWKYIKTLTWRHTMLAENEQKTRQLRKSKQRQWHKRAGNRFMLLLERWSLEIQTSRRMYLATFEMLLWAQSLTNLPSNDLLLRRSHRKSAVFLPCLLLDPTCLTSKGYTEKNWVAEPEARICTRHFGTCETTTIVEESRTGKRDSMAPPAGMGGPIWRSK